MSAPPYHWIQQFDEAIKLLQEIPLWGQAPAFPWEDCAHKLEQAWHLPNMKILEHKTTWRSKQQLLEGLGTNPHVQTFSLNPLTGSAFLALSSEDLSKLTRATLTENGNSSGLSDKRIEQGFYTYMLLEGLCALDTLHPFADLSLRMEKSTELPSDGALCLDIHIQISTHSLFARLLCSNKLCQAFKEHFIQKKSSFSTEHAKNLEIPLRFEIGSTALSLAKWKKTQVGDLLLLDRCGYDPKVHKGSAEIVFGKTPLFRARIKEGSVKILDYAFYFEEETPMMSDDEDDDEYYLDDEDDDFDDDYSEDEDDDDDDDDDNEEEDDDDEDEEEKEENLEDKEKEEKKAPPPGEEAPLWKAEPKSEKTKMAQKIASNKIPLTITVEVARLDMSVEKILQLTPGNELSLPVYPEQGVNLVVNGQRIGKGELIKIGETLGVRILQLGE